MHSTKSFYSTYVTPLYKGHRWRESKMCHLPCQTQQFLRLANCSVTWILYPFGIKYFFCKAFKCIFCLAEYIHHYTGTIVLALKAVFLHGWAYFKVPVHLKSHMPGGLLCLGMKQGGRRSGKEGGVCVNVCFSPRERHRQTKLIFNSNKGWRLEGGGNCQRKCMEEKYIK